MEPLDRSYTTYYLSSYLTLNIIVTFKCGSEVTQCHKNANPKLIRKWPRNTQISVTRWICRKHQYTNVQYSHIFVRNRVFCLPNLHSTPPVRVGVPVTLIWVFLGHFRINLHQTRTQYRNTGTQPDLKKRFLNVEFCRRKTVVLTFLRCVSSKFAAVKHQ